MNHRSISKFILVIAAIFIWGTALAKAPIKIGGPMPLTGPYAGDGVEMKKGLELAMERANEKGGLLGRKVEVLFGDTADMSSENVTSVAKRLLGSKVDAVITYYQAVGSTALTVYGPTGIPYLYAPFRDDLAEMTAKNLDKFSNCLQFGFLNSVFGKDFIKTLSIPEKMGWKAPNKKVMTISIDHPVMTYPAEAFNKDAKEKGYDVVHYEKYPMGYGDKWGPLISKIDDLQPAYITMFNFAGNDAAAFMNQLRDYFGSDGPEALIVMYYVPAVPEFLELAGKNAEGVIWSTSPLELETKQYREFKKRYIAKYKQDPVGNGAMYTYDGFGIWAQAVERAGCVECYSRVVSLIKESVFDGASGSYVFKPDDLSVLMGEYLLPIAYYQIQNQQHVPIEPARFKKGSYQKQPWIK
ncbi:MAG: ABC transporter substrate-binding protein [Deltaproteobacteria bacterium]|jgi:branched-chain amino acid transport system substrate-binding protein|nr:ABC transporter substrate-binding protein [Deltaproteobacteria bacterium]MBT4088809.1 ABC transporter substrate-binding protein [Deltaproteobacteria bacterium]MBT4269532.1 ABC transporter substrate-binding protein [Deltaproteobacteria bacterium]MBT4642625.1 ABC transporter substrate-binding protein [Deltaproteobacteria bacterium]MBT6501288.1 ABC transporter substrate-binding protein [Deltaproteobacteria bacterium]